MPLENLIYFRNKVEAFLLDWGDFEKLAAQ